MNVNYEYYKIFYYVAKYSNFTKAFHAAYPGIRLKIHNHLTLQAIRSVKNGEIDFAVVTTPTNVEAPLKEVQLQPFREVLIGGQSFAALGRREISLAELNEYPLICLGRETMTYQFYHQLFLSHGLELAPDIEAATTDQILPLVRYDLGLAFLPEPMAREAIAKKEVVQISLREKIPERRICMVYDCQRPFGAAVQKIKSLIMEDSLTVL